jgi:beta-lactamase superfamily II metal-dependent hydrolase
MTVSPTVRLNSCPLSLRRRLSRRVLLLCLIAAAPLDAQRGGAPGVRTLDIYVVDTEGGKAALYVSPSGENVLIDTGNPGARDGGRILAVLEAAGVKRIDHLISTHYHRDHVGGLVALAQRIPIAHFLDHGPNVENPEQVRGFRAAYDSLLANAKHTVVKPGDRLAVAGLDWRIVQSAGSSITRPLAGVGAGASNAASCASFERKPEPARPDDNAQSVGSVITFGRFRVLDLGDLLWNEEHDLVCPRNMIGAVDLYMVTHHGLASSGSPQLVHGVRPRVAVMQNGATKGGEPAALQILHTSPGLEDVWALHWSYAGGVEHNSPGAFIANLDSASTIARVLTAAPGQGGSGNQEHAPAHYIKISARANGSFTVTNTRNGFSKTYLRR